MALNYSITMMGNPLKADEPKKAYAKAQINQEVPLKELSRRVAQISTMSRGDIQGVLVSTVEVLLDHLREGNQVNFGELGKFRLQIQSNGAESAEKFTTAHISGVRIQFVPGEDLKDIFSGLTFTPVPSRRAAAATLKAEKAGQTTVDISKNAPSGGNNNPSGGNDPSGGESGGGSQEGGGGIEGI